MSRVWQGIGLFVLILFTTVSATAQGSSPAKNADPYAVYGDCWQGTPANDSVFLSKAAHVFNVGRGNIMAKVAGIVVLSCRPWSGAGGSAITACPVGSPFAYCIRNRNDGAGNDVYLGILELNPKTDPNEWYGGCAPGAQYRRKSAVVLEASETLRGVNAIVVTACRPADGPGGTAQVPCPGGSFYSACYKNANDGAGNHVEFGVVKSFGASDPVGQYGNFSATSTGKYRAKSTIVTDVGRSLGKVLGITVLWAGEDTGGGTRLVDCPMPYSYCARTSGDVTGDSVIVGVTLRP